MVRTDEDRKKHREYMHEYYHKNKEKCKLQMAKYRKNNRDKILQGKKEYYQKNKETISEWKRKYRERNAEIIKLKKKIYHEQNKEKVHIKQKEYYRTKYRDIKRKYDIIYYKQNKEKIKNNVRKWCKSDRGKQLTRVHRANRKSRINNNGGSFTQSEWQELLMKVNGICLCCNNHFGNDLTVDHIVPLSKGGSSFISNIQPLCKSCNSTKHDKTISYLGEML